MTDAQQHYSHTVDRHTCREVEALNAQLEALEAAHESCADTIAEYRAAHERAAELVVKLDAQVAELRDKVREMEAYWVHPDKADSVGLRLRMAEAQVAELQQELVTAEGAASEAHAYYEELFRDKLAQAEERLGEALKALRRVPEWCMEEDGTISCHFCYRRQDQGHADDCARVVLDADWARAVLAAGEENAQ